LTFPGLSDTIARVLIRCYLNFGEGSMIILDTGKVITCCAASLGSVT